MSSPARKLDNWSAQPKSASHPVAVIQSKPPSIQSLQVLRALAATTVLFVHIPCMRWGSFGVDIFFVVSGFTMCYVAGSDAVDFLLKRIFRIVPLYWAATLGVFSVALLVPRLLGSTTTDPLHLVKSLFFIPYLREDGLYYPVLFLGWTLEYEMFFYLLFALALVFKRRNVGPVVIAMLISIVLLGHAFHPSNAVLRFYSSNMILIFGFGICAFLLWKRYQNQMSSLPVGVWILLAVAAYGVALLLDVKLISSHGPYLKAIPGFVLRGIPALTLCLSLLALEGRMKFPWAVILIGDASYSLYLFHPYIFQSIGKVVPLLQRTPLTLTVAFLGILLCFAIAIFSYRFFEYPSNRFLRRTFLRQPSVAA